MLNGVSRSLTDVVPTVDWTAESAVRILDQTMLPTDEVYLVLETVDEVAEAIRALRVRGAPAIGIAAALGLVAALRPLRAASLESFIEQFEQGTAVLAATRPTAVNLHTALQRLSRTVDRAATDSEVVWAALRDEADAILQDERSMCRRIGDVGRGLLGARATVLTHCNAGSLATAGMGTALAPIYAAHEDGATLAVYADETRPLGQGARLTAWELHRAGVPCTVIADSAAGSLLRGGDVDLVLVGADRVTRNGDVANKIGTYSLAVLARHHGVPFYVCFPTSTFDLTLESGDQITIEERSADEVPHPDGVAVFNPAFDVTPAEYVTGYVTDVGILTPPFDSL